MPAAVGDPEQRSVIRGVPTWADRAEPPGCLLVQALTERPRAQSLCFAVRWTLRAQTSGTWQLVTQPGCKSFHERGSEEFISVSSILFAANQSFYSLTYIYPEYENRKGPSRIVHWSPPHFTDEEVETPSYDFLHSRVHSELHLNQNLLDQSTHSHSCSFIPVTFKHPFIRPPREAPPFPGGQGNEYCWMSGKKMRKLLVISALGPVVQLHIKKPKQNCIDTSNIRLL